MIAVTFDELVAALELSPAQATTLNHWLEERVITISFSEEFLNYRDDIEFYDMLFELHCTQDLAEALLPHISISRRSDDKNLLRYDSSITIVRGR